MEHPEITKVQLLSAIMDIVKQSASLLGALAVCGTAIWWTFGAAVDRYIDKKIDLAISSIQVDLGSLKKKQAEQPKVFIEFQGRGLIKSNAQVRPGDTITIVYSLRRLIECSTKVSIQFYSLDKSRIDTSLTREIPATISPANISFSPFVVDVKIPRDASPGFYSYRPILIPTQKDCGPPTRVPFSDPFEVISG